MRNKIYVDTGALIALADATDLYHERTTKAFDECLAQGYRMFTTDYIMDEFLTWARCKRKLSFDKVQEFVIGIQASEIELCGTTEELFGDALKIMKKYRDHYFSFTDCMSFAVMKGMQTKNVLTTDKHFIIAGFKNLLSLQ